MVSKTQLVESAVGVQVPTNGIRMKGNKNNIIQTLWNDLKMSIGGDASDGFPKYQHIIFDDYERLL